MSLDELERIYTRYLKAANIFNKKLIKERKPLRLGSWFEEVKSCRFFKRKKEYQQKKKNI